MISGTRKPVGAVKAITDSISGTTINQTKNPYTVPQGKEFYITGIYATANAVGGGTPGSRTIAILINDAVVANLQLSNTGAAGTTSAVLGVPGLRIPTGSTVKWTVTSNSGVSNSFSFTMNGIEMTN